MHSSSRRRATLVATLAIAALAAPPLTVAAQAAVPPKAGLVGRAILMRDQTLLSGYDVASDGSGNAYIGWIGTDDVANAASRKVYLCTLRPGAGACYGGVQSIDSLGVSSAQGLRVLATPSGAVSLVWFHDTMPDSVNGPRGGRIAVATSQAGGPLSAAQDMADAPSFGQLLDAQFGPGGAIWTIAYQGVGTNAVEVRRGLSAAPETLPTPYSVGTTRLAFHGATAVIAAQPYGSVSGPISSAHLKAGAWTRFASVAGTWAVGSVGLASSTRGVRLIASVNNASYVPAVARFTGAGFAARRPIGDPSSCPSLSHDLVGDPSGRIVDVKNACGQITVASMPDTANAAIIRFPAGGTVAGGDPQIATTTRGRGWVAWSIQSGTGIKLLVGRVLLPALRTSAARRVAQGTVTVTGPASCLPAVGATVGASGRAAAGWRVATTSLLLDNRPFPSRTIDGSRLVPGRVYTLTARVVFTRGRTSVPSVATLRFASCRNP